jgi:hypothetical protein
MTASDSAILPSAVRRDLGVGCGSGQVPRPTPPQHEILPSQEQVAIHYVPSNNPGRAYRLIEQGLKTHRRVRLTTVEAADFVFYHYQSYDASLAFEPEKTVFLDYTDDPRQVFPVDCVAYFKRSWYGTSESGIKNVPFSRPSHFHPISYAIMDEFMIDEKFERDIDLGCFLRPDGRFRKQVLAVAESIHTDRKHVGEITRSGRNVFDREYLTALKRSRIVLTCNPDHWEGDSRTWEALANGTLVFVDRLYTPMRHPLEGGKHCVFYDLTNLQELRDKLEYYLAHRAEADQVAACGFEFAMQFHNSRSRVDDILSCVKPSSVCRRSPNPPVPAGMTEARA